MCSKAILPERNYYSDYDAKMVLSEGCTLSYKTDNSSYETITKIGGELDKKTYNGTFPVDVNAMLGSAAEVSKALAGAIDCNSLETSLLIKYLSALYNDRVHTVLRNSYREGSGLVGQVEEALA